MRNQTSRHFAARGINSPVAQGNAKPSIAAKRGKAKPERGTSRTRRGKTGIERGTFKPERGTLLGERGGSVVECGGSRTRRGGSVVERGGFDRRRGGSRGVGAVGKRLSLKRGGCEPRRTFAFGAAFLGAVGWRGKSLISQRAGTLAL